MVRKWTWAVGRAGYQSTVNHSDTERSQLRLQAATFTSSNNQHANTVLDWTFVLRSTMHWGRIILYKSWQHAAHSMHCKLFVSYTLSPTTRKSCVNQRNLQPNQYNVPLPLIPLTIPHTAYMYSSRNNQHKLTLWFEWTPPGAKAEADVTKTANTAVLNFMIGIM